MIHKNMHYGVNIKSVKFPVKKFPKRLIVLKAVDILDEVLVFIQRIANSVQSANKAIELLPQIKL